ncbi:MAG: ATP-binding cassette domain-containing protein [Sulfolobales archaeon]
MLLVKNLKCELNGYTILENISFTLEKGEAVAIIGPASSGKTILAYCLTGIIPNRIYGKISGEVKLDGEDILGRKPGELIGRVGFLMQNYEAQIFGLTVEEDIRFTLENIGLDVEEITERVNWALKMVGLDRFRHYRTSQLSGGMKKKLVIASLIASRPKILIMDDPLHNLDWIGVTNLKRIIASLKNNGMSFIILAKCTRWLEDILDKTITINYHNYSNSNLECIGAVKTTSTIGSEIYRSYDLKGEIIRMENVWFRYGDRDYIIKNITLSIRRRDIVSLLGANGSGKTTLAKLMSGLLKPTRGNILLLGKNTRRYSASNLARYATIVFQNPDRHIVFDTVFDEVFFGCKNLGLPIENAEKALKIVGLYEKRYEAPYKLSKTEKFLLNIASALAIDPEVLILDESLTICDLDMVAILRIIIDYMYKRDKAVIIVTHDTDLATLLSNRVIIINDGTIAADTKPDILFNDNFTEMFGLKPVSFEKTIK